MSSLGTRLRVIARHSHGAMTEQITNHKWISASLIQPRCKRMSQIVKTKILQTSIANRCDKRGLEFPNHCARSPTTKEILLCCGVRDLGLCDPPRFRGQGYSPRLSVLTAFYQDAVGL